MSKNPINTTEQYIDYRTKAEMDLQEELLATIDIKLNRDNPAITAEDVQNAGYAVTKIEDADGLEFVLYKECGRSKKAKFTMEVK